MNRSSFLKSLISSLVIGKLPIEITKNFRKIYLLQCFVAGFRHYEGMQLITKMKAGDLLELVREPNNEYDECAIALHYQGKKIGFIPADTNEMLSYLLDADALSLFAVITHIENNAQPWENVAIAVYFVQEVVKDLPAHAGYLTRIEAPHYRTLNNKASKVKNHSVVNFDDLFDNTNRVINISNIDESYTDAKNHFEKYYSKHEIFFDKPGKYLQIKDDGIYTYMYEISDDISIVKSKDGNEYFEFSLV